MQRSICRYAQSLPQKWDANWGPRSEVMVSGSPWRWNTYWMNRLAKSLASTVDIQGTRYQCLVKQSTTTQIASQPLDHGRPTMKSMLMSCHGAWVIGSELRSK